MNDPRIDSMIAAVTARHPAARVELHPPLPEEIQVPTFLIILDADLDTRRDARKAALERMFVLFAGESTPVCVVVVDPRTAAEFVQVPSWAASPARGD